LRGVDLIVAVTFVSEIGNLSRFESPRGGGGKRALIETAIGRYKALIVTGADSGAATVERPAG